MSYILSYNRRFSRRSRVGTSEPELLALELCYEVEREVLTEELAPHYMCHFQPYLDKLSDWQRWGGAAVMRL